MNPFQNNFNKQARIVPKTTTFEYKRKTPEEIKIEKEENKTREMFNKVNNLTPNKSQANFNRLNNQRMNSIKNNLNRKNGIL
ncbi:MAG: hypothetical protein NC181_02680 [Clostridium sp.]|nr:hypothetical protein [Clostridium sp.]MCM1444133.1 hypothetical protein [Candidatus Amulumruptor caecigallinarius]